MKALVLALALLTFVKASAMGIDREEAIRIAEPAAVRLGYRIGSMTVSASLLNSSSNVCLREDSQGRYIDEQRAKLAGKSYWQIHFSPFSPDGVPLMGGDACIFVDAETGEVLGVYRGK